MAWHRLGDKPSSKPVLTWIADSYVHHLAPASYKTNDQNLKKKKGFNNGTVTTKWYALYHVVQYWKDLSGKETIQYGCDTIPNLDACLMTQLISAILY